LNTEFNRTNTIQQTNVVLGLTY